MIKIDRKVQSLTEKGKTTCTGHLFSTGTFTFTFTKRIDKTQFTKMSGAVVKLYHSTVFLVIFSSFVYNHLYVKIRPDDTLMTYKGYGGKFKYLTFWYFVSKLVLCGLSLMCWTNEEIWFENFQRADYLSSMVLLNK